ncbi:LysR family transcriptional regulator [Pigmentiphaga sp. D-2]|uniref:LysR family transcriptional regulator n=1 Tax=Pigmentiphaga sp. D-2 TaxID=1002116 RepID=UPI001FB5F282|nr:LysR family transcriptional regulator [Pigmentiphaga sp. D-2]
MDRFVAMSVFRKVVEHESFTLAARQLGMSVGSVSKYLTWLELHLGTSGGPHHAPPERDGGGPQLLRAVRAAAG